MDRGGIKNGKAKGSGFNNTGVSENAMNASPGSFPISTGNTAAKQQEKGDMDGAER